MALTVTEKEHWKDRISRRIDRAIETTYAAVDAGFRGRIADSARKLAVESLGIAKLEERRQEIERQKKALDREDEVASQQVFALVRGCDVVEAASVASWTRSREVEEAIKLRQELQKQKLLAESEAGRRILGLIEEKEELLDTVWLATSGKQIKELWGQVSKLLDQEPTSLQADALRIEASEDSS